MGELLRALRHAWRGLARTPAVTAVGLASLALGSGGITTLFTLVNAVFLRGLPVERSEELVVVHGTLERIGAAGNFLPISRPDFEDYRDRNEVFAGLACLLSGTAVLATGPGEPEVVDLQLVSGNFFEVLGVRPALGRFFTAAEDEVPDRDLVAVLSYREWRDRFGSDPGTVGRTVSLNGRPFTIVGVAPAGFTGPVALGNPDLWVPTMVQDPALLGTGHDWFKERRALITFPFGRLKPGVTREEAQAALRAIARNLGEEYPEESKGRGVVLLPFSQASIPPQSPPREPAGCPRPWWWGRSPPPRG